jgi:hypothetical protein
MASCKQVITPSAAIAFNSFGSGFSSWLSNHDIVCAKSFFAHCFIFVGENCLLVTSECFASMPAEGDVLI